MQNSPKQGWMAVETFSLNASPPLFILDDSKKMGSGDEVLGCRSLKPALIYPCEFKQDTLAPSVLV